MLERLIDFSLQRRGLVVFVTLLLVGAGLWSAFRVPIDAVPDITNPQVQINTPVDALAPDEIETLVTVPLEREMAGLPDMIELRSLSKFGLSQITMTFRDGVDIYRLRQLVTERLAHVRAELPASAVPVLAPISTGLGEIVYYSVDYTAEAPKPASRAEQLRELRILHDFQIRPALRATPGVAEVNAIGGYERQIVIAPDPQRLTDAGVSFSDLAAVVRKGTENAGGGLLELGGEAIVVRANTRSRSLADLAALPVKFIGGAATPLTVGDLATVSIGSAVRTGASTKNGEETVTGAAIMLAGDNSRLVAHAVVERLRHIQEKLPRGVRLEVTYDRSDLVDATIRTVEVNLFEGALFVGAILFALLGNWRAALIVTAAIPLSFLFMLTGMVQTKISANLMSLGAIDFGLIVDGAIVMVENIMRHVAERQRELGRLLTRDERLGEVRRSAREVARPMFFGVLIITLVYVPILALTGVEGKMFRPMAITVMLALAGALVLALTLMPVLSSWFLSGRIREDDGLLVRGAKALYAPLLSVAFRFRVAVVVVALGLFAASGWLFTRLGAEFIPQLDEGALAIQMIRGNSVDLGSSIELQRRSERLLLDSFPEVSHVFARLGTAEIAMDPMGPNTADTYVFFQPPEKWRQIDGRRITKAELTELMRRELVARVPGQTYLFTQPVQMRFNEIMAGARADLSLKIYGEEFEVMERLATEARDLLRSVPGGGDVEFDALGRVPAVEITPKRDQLRRLGLHPDDINAVVASALAGEDAGLLIDGSLRTAVVVRLPEQRRLDLASFGELPITTPEGVQVPLGRVADVAIVDRVGSITREDTRRRVMILINVRGRDTAGFVAEAQEKLRANLKLPPGYFWEFGGQFENMEAAKARLLVVVPAALALIFGLIYLSFGSVRQALLIFVCVPLAATGGVAALWVRDMPFTISAAVGFIALSGIAVLNGIMLLSFVNQLRGAGRDVRTAVVEGTLTRLRPKIMTALVASLGFVPMALSSGLGAEVQRPVATVVIGGVLTSTFLTLIVLPVLYDWIEGARKNQP